jgi:hypothetical protein
MVAMRLHIFLILSAVCFQFVYLPFPAHAQLIASTVICNAFIYDRQIDVNMVLYVDANDPFNSLVVPVLLDENAELVTARDTLGVIPKDHVKRLSGGTIELRTNTGPKRTQEVLQLFLITKHARSEEFAPLYSAELQCPASQQSEVTIYVKGARIFSFETTYGFRGVIDKHGLIVKGKGPGSVKFFFTMAGEGVETEHYVIFNHSSLSLDNLKQRGFNDADGLYYLIPSAFGFLLPYERLPMVVLDEQDYAKQVNPYSEGIYRTGGVVLLNAKVFRENGAPVILHETVHALNAHVMAWNRTDVAWFDEGTAKFIEEVARRKLGMRVPELFCCEQQYRQGNKLYILEPESSLGMLTSYYANNDSYMRSWNGNGDATREFGYAYSTLFIKLFVMLRGESALRELYAKLLDQNHEISDAEEFTSLVETLAGMKFEPCKYEHERQIIECVEKVNAYEPNISLVGSAVKLGLQPTRLVLLSNAELLTLVDESTTMLHPIQPISSLITEAHSLLGKALYWLGGAAW